MGGKTWSGLDATKGIMRYGNYFDASRKMGGGRASQTWGTGNSSMSYGNVTIDPRIRQIQEQNLAKNNNLYNELGESGRSILGDLRGLRSRYEGNQSAYIQSRLDPYQQQFATRRGELQGSIGLRGLGGSSFGEQALTNFDIDTQRALGDVRAQAENENLQALTGLSAQEANTLFSRVANQASLTNADSDTAKAMLQQELSALGLGSQQQQLMMNAFESWQGRGNQDRQNIAQDIIGGFNASANMTNANANMSRNTSGTLNTSGTFCFVAEALYGIDSEKTHTIREFVGRHIGDKSLFGIFLSAYRKYGRKWAELVSKNKAVRAIARIIWDRMFELAETENGKRKNI